MPPAVEVQSLNRWTSREVPLLVSFYSAFSSATLTSLSQVGFLPSIVLLRSSLLDSHSPRLVSFPLVTPVQLFLQRPPLMVATPLSTREELEGWVWEVPRPGLAPSCFPHQASPGPASIRTPSSEVHFHHSHGAGSVISVLISKMHFMS